MEYKSVSLRAHSLPPLRSWDSTTWQKCFIIQYQGQSPSWCYFTLDNARRDKSMIMILGMEVLGVAIDVACISLVDWIPELQDVVAIVFLQHQVSVTHICSKPCMCSTADIFKRVKLCKLFMPVFECWHWTDFVGDPSQWSSIQQSNCYTHLCRFLLFPTLMD